jgi:hypothetical protein
MLSFSEVGMRTLWSLVASVTSVSLASTAIAQHDGHAGNARAEALTLGSIVFPNSGNRASQEPFIRGIALLHSFEYIAAAGAFREAQRADPSLSLAYWGEALTYSQALWRIEDLPAARAALSRLALTPHERLARARTPRERSFGAAVEAFFVDAPLPQRAHAYADSMRQRARAEPTDYEAAAFAAYALLLDGSANPTAREALFREAVGLAQMVAIKNPNHPGATHYLIHLYDSPGMAPQGLAFARAYDKIAPDAEHALHMPSHIYLQLGLWNDDARSNERAWAASRAAAAKATGRLDWHSLSWLHYAYLQQGRFKAARALIDTARALVDGSSAYGDDAFVLTRLEFQQAAETGMWPVRPLTRPAAPTTSTPSDRERGFRLLSNYWIAVDAVQRVGPDLQAVAAPYLAIADSVRAGAVLPPAQAANALVIHALIAKSRGDTAAALASLRMGAALEVKLNAFSGPPERLFASELLATQLIDIVRASRTVDEAWRTKALDEAAGALESVLRACPNRTKALLLLANVRTLAGDRTAAAEVFAKVRANWANADADVLGLLP